MHCLKCSISLVALLFATSAFAGPADTYAIHAMIAAAKPGAVIALPPGAYVEQRVTTLNPTATVTVKGGPGVTINGLGIDKSSNITFDTLEFTSATRTGLAINVGDSHDIALNNLNVHSATPGLSGVTLRDGSNLSLTNTEIHDLGTGIQLLNVEGAKVLNNHIHDINGDGFKSGNSNNVLVDGNLLENLTFVTGDHPDAIQFMTPGQTAGNHDIAITNNVYRRGTAVAGAQGIFLGNESNVPYQNVTITGNQIVGGMYRGISVSVGGDVTIKNNFVQGFADMSSGIFVDSISGTATIDGNVTSSAPAVDVGVTPKSTGKVAITNTKTVAAAAVGDVKAATAWLAAKTAPPVVVAPPTVNPLQAQLDAANARLAAIQAQVTADASTITQLQGQVTLAQQALAAEVAKEAALKAAVAKLLGLAA